MSEDLSVNMDKKNFSLTPTTKSLPSEPSRSTPRQDGPGSSQLVRKPLPRRRDSPLGASSAATARLDPPPRKPSTQKKTLDKKPRPRPNQNPRQVEESSSDGEMRYLPTTGGKKQNLTHLLNFHFTPREGSSGNLWRTFNTRPTGSWRGSRANSRNVNHPKFSKEHFLQANCQFLVKDTGDYTVYNFDPDILVEWAMIEQIKIRVIGESPVCPICLSLPSAAKMTKCGHIFCWPCMLHYLALSDKTSRSCPICFELIAPKDLKSVITVSFVDIEVGQEISLQLMARHMNSTESMPLSCKNGVANDYENSYSKLLTVSAKEVLAKVVERERGELKARLAEDEDCPEACFIHQALTYLGTRKRSLEYVFPGQICEMVPMNVGPTMKELALGLKPQMAPAPIETAKPRAESTDSDDTVVAKPLGIDDELCYFYQADDGQNIYLHPVNMAMFWKNYGPEPLTWPQIVKAKVIEKETLTMNDIERKRYKFLRHLPLTTGVHLVEVELKEPMISEDTLKEFEDQLSYRRGRREERIRKEKKREELIELEERKKRNPYPRPKIESKLDFPTCGTDEEYDGLQHALLASLEESHLENTNESESAEDVPSTSQLPAQLSFRDREKKSLDVNYPSLVTNASNEDSDASITPRQMSFAQAISSRSAEKIMRRFTTPAPTRELPGMRQSEVEQETEEYSAPNFRSSVSDAIAKALATHEDKDAEGATAGSSSQKKKGRKKGKVLFATGMGMGSN